MWDGIQFSHTIEEQVGGLLQAGFRLTHLYEDTNGEGNLHEHGIPTFFGAAGYKREVNLGRQGRDIHGGNFVAGR